ncbi:MAG: hypothetical protein ACRDLN_07460, partial [Solirubrobacteraceae bacterium]
MDRATTLPSSHRAPPHASRLLVHLAVALSLAAGYAHFAYADSHFEEWWAYGVFFVAAGNLQMLFAALLLWRPRAWLVLAGIAGNIAIVGVYVISRTAGVPLGPHARVVEEAHAIDWVTAAGEIAIVVTLIAMLEGR